MTAYSADGEALQTVDRLPDGSPIQVRNGTYVDLDVGEIFSSGASWIDVLYDPVLGGADYFVVSGQKGLQSSYAVEGSGDFRTVVGRASRGRSQAVFRLTRALRPVDANVVMGQDLPDGYRPVFLRSDNPAGGTRLVPGLPAAYRASDIIFNNVHGQTRPFDHGEGVVTNYLTVWAEKPTDITLEARDVKGNLLGAQTHENTAKLQGTPEDLIPNLASPRNMRSIRARAGARMSGESGLHNIVNGGAKSIAVSNAAGSLDYGRTLMAPNVRAGDGRWSEFRITNTSAIAQSFAAEGYRVRDAGINGLVREKVGERNFNMDPYGHWQLSLDELLLGAPEQAKYVLLRAYNRDGGEVGPLVGTVVVGDSETGTMDAYLMRSLDDFTYLIEPERSFTVEHNDGPWRGAATVIARGRYSSIDSLSLEVEGALGPRALRAVLWGMGERVRVDDLVAEGAIFDHDFPVTTGTDSQQYPSTVRYIASDSQSSQTDQIVAGPVFTVREEQDIDVDAYHQTPGYSFNRTKEGIPELSQLMFESGATDASGNDASLEQWKKGLRLLTDGTDQELSSIVLKDKNNRIEFLLVGGGGLEFFLSHDVRGEEYMEQLKAFYQVQ